MSLPLPGWTLLRELGNQDLQRLADALYRGDGRGDGINLRSSGLTPSLTTLSTDLIVRTHIHTRVWVETGTPQIGHAHHALLTEMLLAAHSLVSTASIAKTALTYASSGNPLALRHLNLPVLARTGLTALEVVRQNHERRNTAAQDWDELLTELARPWQLDRPSQPLVPFNNEASSVAPRREPKSP